MVPGADLLRYLLSSGGVLLFVLAGAIWLVRSPQSRAARRYILIVTVVYTAMSLYGAQYLAARTIALGFRPFTAASAAVGKRTAIVLLGSGSQYVEDWNGRPFSMVDRIAAGRVLEAVRVYKMIDPAFVIASGGNPHASSPVTPTAETMRDALVTLGVPGDRIMIETASRTTRDEAVIVAAMLQAQGVEQVILVTSQSHMRRALGAFRAAGVGAIPAIAREFDADVPVSDLILPTDEGLWVGQSNLHELIGTGYYILRGWWTR